MRTGGRVAQEAESPIGSRVPSQAHRGGWVGGGNREERLIAGRMRRKGHPLYPLAMVRYESSFRGGYQRSAPSAWRGLLRFLTTGIRGGRCCIQSSQGHTGNSGEHGGFWTYGSGWRRGWGIFDERPYLHVVRLAKFVMRKRVARLRPTGERRSRIRIGASVADSRDTRDLESLWRCYI